MSNTKNVRNDAQRILDHWLVLLNYRYYREIAEFLNVKPNTIDTWKSRGSVPNKEVRRFNNLYAKMKNKFGEVKEDTIAIPKLSITASCGSTSHLEGIDSFETQGNIIIDSDTLKVSNGTLKAIKVDGNSMVPTLLPESWVVFNEHGDYVGEGLYVLNWRNILMVKLLQINAEGKLRIISVNKDYESYTLNPDDQSIFRIIGKVVRVIM